MTHDPLLSAWIDFTDSIYCVNSFFGMGHFGFWFFRNVKRSKSRKINYPDDKNALTYYVQNRK